MLNTLNQVIFSIVLIVLALAFPAHAQSLPDEVQFDRINIPGTIRSSQVEDIVQDKLGLIWIAGHGLYRYDGVRFKQYTSITNNADKLSSRDIHQLVYDHDQNRILLGTQRFGIVEYNYNNDQLRQLPANESPPVVNMMLQDKQGKIWAGSYASGLFFLENDTLKKLPDPEKRFLHPSGMASAGSKLFIGLQGRIVVLENGKFEEEIKLNNDETTLPLYSLITSLFVDDIQQLWIGTEKYGVLVYDLKGKKFTKRFPPTQAPFFSKIMRIMKDRSGLVWILTKANGVALYSPETDEILHLNRDPFSSKAISSDNCFSIVQDREGIVWIGATGDINKYNRNQIKFKHLYHNPSDKMSLTDNMIRGLFEDKNGRVWAGTDGGYINIIDPLKGTVDYIKVKVENDSANYVPLYFHQLNERIVLVGTSLGLLQFDLTLKKFSPYKPLWNLTKNRNIRQLLIQNDVLFFAYNGHLYEHNLATQATHIFENGGNPLAINITAIHLDRLQRLWVGSNSGVSCYESKSKTFTFVPLKEIISSSNASLMMTLSMNDIGNKLYVTTFNEGLFVIDISDVKKIPTPKKYDNLPGLSSNTIYSALAGNDGYLWLSTNNGLVRFDTTSSRFVSFTISEGVQEEEFNRLAYCKMKDGKLVFGGINGVNYFDPAEVKISNEQFTPKVVSIFATNPLLKTPNPIRISNPEKSAELQYEQNFISIHFFVPNFELPKRYVLYYQLENFEKEWKEVASENSVSYSNLQPGKYTFLLKSVSLNGTEQVLRLPITIHTPYWKTWWFIVIAILVSAFLMMTIITSYTSRSQRDRERLEELLRVRTSEIQKSREELQILNEKKDLIFSILSHDLRSPLTTLKGFLGYVIDHADELTTEELKRHAVNIRNSVSNSLDLIDNTLFWSLSQMGTIQYTPTHFALHTLLEKLKGLYQLTADKKRIPFSISCPEDILVNGDENMIYVTLRNLVSNALKFTNDGNPVSITCISRDGNVEINVVDRGVGMSKEYVNRILSVDQPMLKKGTSNERGTGLGLLLCKNFIEQNKGELRIASIENIGTTFTVIFPAVVSEQPVQEVAKV